MPEVITKTCPLCGRLAIRMCTGQERLDRDGNLLGWSSKFACFTGTTRGSDHWQETAALLPRRVNDSGAQKPQTAWAILNGLPDVFNSPAQLDAAAVVRATADRQRLFDGGDRGP